MTFHCRNGLCAVPSINTASQNATDGNGTAFRTETVSGTALAAGMGLKIRPAASALRLTKPQANVDDSPHHGFGV